MTARGIWALVFPAMSSKTIWKIIRIAFVIFGIVAAGLMFKDYASGALKTPNLKGAWRFEGNANDWSGAGFNGTASSTLTTSGKFGRAYSFNGSADRISLGTGSVAICPTAPPFTVTA